MSHVTHFRIGDRVFEQLHLDDDSTIIIDVESETVLMQVTATCKVTFPAFGNAIHGMMYMNAVDEWIYQPYPDSPLNIPFSTGHKYLINGEVELFKTFFQASRL